jgi:hypothetical protein
MTFVGCGDGDDPPNVTASPGAVNLAKGKKSTVTARVDGRAASSAVTWRSSNNSIATVVEGTGGTAEITAVGVGQATVTVSQDDASATVNVTVLAASIESLAIMPTAPMITPSRAIARTPWWRASRFVFIFLPVPGRTAVRNGW